MRQSVGRIRQKFPDTIVLVRSGNFYRCYDDDSYIIAYLMDYQVKTTVISEMAGFSVDSLNKVLDKLEMKRISYKIFESESGEISKKQECDFKEDNCYSGILKKAERYIMIKNRISKVSDILQDNIENARIDEILSKIEKIVYNEL